MRVVGLGQWLYYIWHLPTLLLALSAVVLAGVMGRSLVRDHLNARARQLRWSVLGWSSMVASLLTLAAWPYLVAVSSIRVTPDGSWRLTNYLGVELAELPAREVRTLRGVDLGGLRWGSGHLQVVRADGRVYTSVRIGGSSFDDACRVLGYTPSMMLEQRGGVVIPAHVYTPAGPRLMPVLASRE